MRPFMEAARPMFAFLWLFVITTIWVLFSRNQILDLEPRIMFILFGTLFSNIAVSRGDLLAKDPVNKSETICIVVPFNCCSNV